MFKSIQYTLTILLCILVLLAAGVAYAILNHHYLLAAIAALACGSIAYRVVKNQQRFDSNIIFLLNALDNGDYSFRFAEGMLSRRERELNMMFNRIKDMLTNARKTVIENEKFLSLVVESVPTGIVMLDDRNNVQHTNHAALDLLGLHIFTHLEQLSTINPQLPATFRQLTVGDSTQLTIANEREDMQVSLRMSEIKSKKGVLKVVTINSIGNELEAKELDSWIRLIRVLTHEIMNSIAPISSLSETLLDMYKSADYKQAGSEMLNNTIEAFETIHTTAKGLLSFVESYRKFTGMPKPELKLFQVKPVVEKVLLLEASSIAKSRINVHITCEDEAITVDADEGQITQVLINLICNAEQAIQSNEGDIEITIYRNPANQKATIAVSNTGQPIPEEVLPHIFVPFFTTKQSGNGIGLSLSRYIMRLHGGNLKHHTSAEGLTVFSMIF